MVSWDDSHKDHTCHIIHLFDVFHNCLLDVNIQFCDDLDVVLFAWTLNGTAQ